MYNDTLNGSTEKRTSELPDAVGPIVQLQEKLYVPVKEYPDVSMPHTHHLLLIFLHFLWWVRAKDCGSRGVRLISEISLRLKLISHQATNTDPVILAQQIKNSLKQLCGWILYTIYLITAVVRVNTISFSLH